jgi:hypothetical protein
MQDVSSITTAISKIAGRLKVGVGCPHGKKKCLKCSIHDSKKDGEGGGVKIGVLEALGYGPSSALKTYTSPKAVATTKKPHRRSWGSAGMKMKGIRSITSTINSLTKKMKFKKTLNKLNKPKATKYAFKGII